MVTSSIVGALSSVGTTRLVEHLSNASRARRRLSYVIDWLKTLRSRSRLNVYSHVDLARFEGILPQGRTPPFAVFIHGWEAWWPMSAMTRKALTRARWILVNSQTTVDLARRANPWFPRAIVVPLGLAEAPPEPGPWPRPQRVVMLGRLEATERQKGHELVLDGWPTIAAHCPEAELIIIGQGSDLERVKRKVSEAKLRNVTFEGFVTDERKWELLRTARVLAFPSTQEGFGLAAIEAGAVATPVVALTNTAIAEVFDGSRGAILVADRTPDAIASALLQLLRDDQIAEEMGQHAFSLVTTTYLAQHFQARLLRALSLA